MDALMAALVAALLVSLPDRAALLVAGTLKPRGMLAIAVLVATVMAIGSVALGVTIAPRLVPSARLLMVALSLGFVGIEFLVRGLPTASRGGIAMAIMGSGLWFVVLALAMRSALPWLAAVGAIVGLITVLAAAAASGRRWSRLPLRIVRRLVGALLTVVAAVMTCVALGIV